MICFWSPFLPESKASLGRKLGDHRAHLFSFPSLCASCCFYYFLKTIISYILISSLFRTAEGKVQLQSLSHIETWGTIKISQWSILCTQILTYWRWGLSFGVLYKSSPGYPNVYSGSGATDQKRFLHQSYRKDWVHMVRISEGGGSQRVLIFTRRLSLGEEEL